MGPDKNEVLIKVRLLMGPSKKRMLVKVQLLMDPDSPNGQSYLFPEYIIGIDILGISHYCILGLWVVWVNGQMKCPHPN